MGIPAITVDLDDDQIEEIEPMRERVRVAAAEGKPGMLLAQIIGGVMKVFFATGEQAAEMQRIMGSRVGMTTDDLKQP